MCPMHARFSVLRPNSTGGAACWLAAHDEHLPSSMAALMLVDVLLGAGGGGSCTDSMRPSCCVQRAQTPRKVFGLHA